MISGLIVLILSISSGLLAQDELQGQETWGGDASALKFVKYGRLIGYELLMQKKCQEALPVKPEVWDQLVDKTSVESTEKEKKSQPGRIYFELYKWWYLKKEWKLEFVLKSYAEQLGLPLESQKIQNILRHCVGEEKLWVRNSNPTLRSSKVNVKKEIALHLNDLGLMIQAKKVRSLPLEFRIKEFEELTQLINSSDPKVQSKKIDLDTTPISILFSENRIKDAQNTVSKGKLSLVFNSNVWSLLSSGQKKELLLHEILGLMRLDDSRYQHSSRLMFDLEKKDYEIP